MEDSGEFDPVHVRADDDAGGACDPGSPCARSVSSAFERELDALRTDVYGDVRDSRCRRECPAQITSRLVEVGFHSGILRLVVQFADLGLSVRGCSESGRVRGENRWDGGGEQYDCSRLLQTSKSPLVIHGWLSVNHDSSRFLALWRLR